MSDLPHVFNFFLQFRALLSFLKLFLLLEKMITGLTNCLLHGVITFAVGSGVILKRNFHSSEPEYLTLSSNFLLSGLPIAFPP